MATATAGDWGPPATMSPDRVRPLFAALALAPSRTEQDPSFATTKWRLSACLRPPLYRGSQRPDWPRQGLTSPSRSATPVRSLDRSHGAERRTMALRDWPKLGSITLPLSAPSSAPESGGRLAHWASLPFVPSRLARAQSGGGAAIGARPLAVVVLCSPRGEGRGDGRGAILDSGESGRREGNGGPVHFLPSKQSLPLKMKRQAGKRALPASAGASRQNPRLPPPAAAQKMLSRRGLG